MEPWYNMNRIEQIIGRGVRNFSHKDLPFEERNVQIFLYGTLLENNVEESADLYVYRVAEYKAVQIGAVSRVLKETAVDCIINHDQVNFTQKNIEHENKLNNEKIEQQLSSGLKISDFKVGDAPYSATCDYMSDCEYKCYPDKTIQDGDVKEHTYNEAFIMMNSEKLLQKIRSLFKERFFYKKKDLLDRIDIPKPYPRVQVYAALTQLIENRNESITDIYGRSGYLINIDEYYLFQPSELNNKQISMFERSAPIDFKHDILEMNLEEQESQVEPTYKDDIIAITRKERVKKAIKNKDKDLEEIEKDLEDKEKEVEEKSKVMNALKANFDIAINTAKTATKIERGDDNWYKHCGITMQKLIKDGIPESDVLDFLVEHLVDMTLYNEKVELLNYIFSKEVIVEKSFESLIKKYLDKKIIKTRNITGIVLFSGTIRKVMILSGKIWVDAQSEDILDLTADINTKYKIQPTELNKIVGFIGYENKNKYLVFKVKHTEKGRNTGARCDESRKSNKLEILNELAGLDKDGKEKYTKDTTRGIVQAELCSMQEFLFRYNNKNKKNGKIYFLDFETASMNDF